MIGPGMELHESEVADFIQSKAPPPAACGPSLYTFVWGGPATREEKGGAEKMGEIRPKVHFC